MGAMVYLLQASACMCLFYGFYYLMLSRLTFFTINRWYLVVTLILNFAIPLLTITVRPDAAPIIKQAVYVNQLQTFQTETAITYAPQVTEPVTNWLDVLKMGYLLAVIILSIRLIIMLAAFFSNIKSKRSTKIGNVHILHGDKKLNNGSFLNYIFLNDDDLSPDEIRQIIEHEMLHVKLLHSVDRILVKIAQIFLWFNPFVYLYVRAIEENHEFEVDREIGLSNDKSKYADMLLHLSVARQGMLYNSFSMVPLKKRITMLFTKPTNHMKKVIYLLVLPVVMLSCLAFARLKNDVPVKHKNSQKNKVILPDTNKGIVATITKSNKVVGVVKFPPAAKVLANSGPVKPADTNKTIFATITKNNKVIGVVKFPPNATVSKAEPKTDYETQENTRSTTAAEKQIISRTLADPASPFFNRFHFQREGGNGFDVIAFKLVNGGGSAILDAGGKAAAFIDGEFYNEDNLKKLSTEEAKRLVFDYSPDRSKHEKIPGDNYAMPFSFKTKTNETPVDTIKTQTRPTPAARPDKPQKAKSTAIPAVKPKKSFLSERSADHEVLITIDSAADAHNRLLTQEVIKRIHHKQFYNRIKFTALDGKNYDYVACAIGKNLTTAPIKLNARVGLLIDGIFYDEEAIKKLPESKTQKLEMWYEGLDAKKVPKGYIAALSLKTKKL